MDRKTIKYKLGENDYSYRKIAKAIIRLNLSPEDTMLLLSDLVSNCIQYFIDGGKNEIDTKDIIDNYLEGLRLAIEEKAEYLKDKEKDKMQ